MRWTAVEQIPQGFGPSVVTLGNFDGVHRGHQAILGRTVELAREREANAVAVTFDPHPSTVHNPSAPAPALMSLAGRLDFMEHMGLDGVLTVPYTRDFADLTPENFVQRYLVAALQTSAVVVGSDVRFGRANSGDLETLREAGRTGGFDVEVAPDVGEGIGAGRPRWSSTGVRHLVGDGDVEEAAAILGRPHRVTGVVVRGDGRGRTLGFPTANLGEPLEGMVPADGVYAGWMTRLDLPPGAPGAYFPVAISVGTNPTFSGKQRRVEAHVPGRDDLDLYGRKVALDFVVRLRRTLAFHSPEALVAQMHDDVRATWGALTVRRR
jgi:riboflavin kinase/FMN adenylyltransferase